MNVELKDLLALLRAIDRLWYDDNSNLRRNAELITEVRFAANRIEAQLHARAPEVKVIDREESNV